MKTLLRIALVLALSSCATAAFADAPLVFCAGSTCGGSGPSDYAYRIDSGSYPMMEFRVGTNDLDMANYTNVLIPRGWTFVVEERPMSHAHGVHTPHGEVSPGPCWCLTAGTAVWSTDDPANAVEFFTFAFDHPWKPEDVGWDLLTRREGPPATFYEFHPFWDAPVGTGMGPLHGPYERTEFVLEMDAAYSGGRLSMDFTVGTPAPASWLTFLILTYPTPSVIQIWSVPLPVIAPPVRIPVAFPFPSLRTVGIFSGLFSEGLTQSYILEWIDTGADFLDFTGDYLFTIAYEDGSEAAGSLRLAQEASHVDAVLELPHLAQDLSGTGQVDGDRIVFDVVGRDSLAPEPTSLTFNGRGIDLNGDGAVESLSGEFDGTECTDTCDEVVGDFDGYLEPLIIPTL